MSFARALRPAPYLLLAVAVLLSCPAAAWPDKADVKPLSLQACEDKTAFSSLWLALSGHGEARSVFPLPEILIALRNVQATEPFPASMQPDIGYYRPAEIYDIRGNLWRQTEIYAEAASVYEDGNYPRAIKLFDAIVAKGNRDSRFRAAAAYTAARAEFLQGHLAEGAARAAAILRDPTLREFWPETWNLIAYFRFKANSAPLAAAELAQISRLMTTPTETLCRDDPSGDVFGRTILAEEDFSLASEAPAFRNSEYLVPGLDYARREPVIAAELEMGKSLARDRSGWKATRNPLWAVALGGHGEPQDLSLLVDAIGVVRDWPGASSDAGGLSARAKAGLVVALSAERARILLNAGNPALALAAMRMPTPDERATVARDPPDLVREKMDLLVNGGARDLLLQHQWMAARRWAISASASLHWPIEESLKPFLAADLDELFAHPELRLTPVDGETRLGALRWLLDRWSSHQLIDFSRRPYVSENDRRAMVGAAWIRAFALSHWDDVIAWLPDLRIAYPALGPDIDLIDRAWLASTKRRLALHLALRSPGLVALPSWSREPNGPQRWEYIDNAVRPADIFSFDPWHASDGNWWCASQTEVEDWGDERHQEALPANALFKAIAPLYREGDGKELAALTAKGSSAERFAEDAVAWGNRVGWLGRRFGMEDHLPETLYLAVRATRFGCRRPEDNSPWSRAAYTMLHRRFPSSEWARRTPYWFGVIR
jgi:hypothetical protein